MTPERRAAIEAMLDSDRYGFTYGGYIGALSGDERHEEDATGIVRELLTEVVRLRDRVGVAEAVLSAIVRGPMTWCPVCATALASIDDHTDDCSLAAWAKARE